MYIFISYIFLLLERLHSKDTFIESEVIFIIRNAVAKDASKIALIKVDGWKNAYKGIISNEFLDTLNYEEEEKRFLTRIKGEHDKPSSSIIVYESDNEVRGFSCYGNNMSSLTNDYGEIFALYISSEYRRKGAGKEMIAWIKDELKKQGFKHIIIWCLKHNLPSIEFYKAVGGTVYGEKNIEFGGMSYEEMGFIYEL